MNFRKVGHKDEWMGKFWDHVGSGLSNGVLSGVPQPGTTNENHVCQGSLSQVF